MTAPTRLPTRVPALLLSVGGGLVAGIAAKAADFSGWQWADDLGHYPAAWVLVVALIGWRAPSLRTAAVRSAAFFAAMSVGYYAWAALVLDRGWELRGLAAWLVLSATAVAVTGAAGHVATRRTGRLPGAVLAMAAGIVLGGGVLAHPGAHPVQAVVDVVVAVVLVVVLPRDGRTRLAAVVLTAPLTWVAAQLLDVLRAVLG
jgi:hypothetical protein